MKFRSALAALALFIAAVAAMGDNPSDAPLLSDSGVPQIVNQQRAKRAHKERAPKAQQISNKQTRPEARGQ